MSNSKIQRGKVNWFDKKKGFGFIFDESGREIFVHQSNILSDGFRFLVEGEEVTFEVEAYNKGEKAVNVTRINPPPPPERRNRREVGSYARNASSGNMRDNRNETPLADRSEKSGGRNRRSERGFNR